MFDFINSESSIYKKALEVFLQNKASVLNIFDFSANVNFEKIKDFNYGHLTLNTAMQYAKIFKISPMALAEELKKELENINEDADFKAFSKIEVAAPGFVNLTLSNEYFVKLTNHILQNKDFGKNDLENGKHWSIEHTSPNPNKAMHIGHLRNNLVGMSLTNLLENYGAKVTKEAVMNDRGIAIAKLMYGYLYGQIIPNSEARQKSGELNLHEFINYWVNHKDDWHTPEILNIGADLFTSQCYIAGEEMMPVHETEIRQLVIDWENGDEENHVLWKYVLDYSYKGMNKTLKRLGSSWDKVWYESEHYKEGKDLVEEGLQKGIFQKLEDGAVLTSLSSYNIPDTILQKRDGTSLYITQDLSLTKKKKSENKADKLVWIVGPDQSLAMKQVFACCEQLGIGKLEDFWHITYGYVGLADKDGNFVKMSSRKGNVLLIDDLLDLVKEKVKLEMKESDDERAEKLALAAVKFAILKSGKDESLTFDIDNSIDMRGDTGIYIMYTLARIHSILEKSESIPDQIIETELFDRVSTSTTLLRTLFFYPLAIEKSFNDKSTHHIAQYLLELAGAFNSFYEQEKIIDEADTGKVKIALAKATKQVILHALSILNIEPVLKI